MPKHKPPSRIRYEKSHPTISFRLDLETKQRLKNVLEKKSVASFIKEALGQKEREKESLEYELKKRQGEGFRNGYMRAKMTYAIRINCEICGEEVMIDEKLKKDIESYLKNKRICHTGCIEDERRKRML